MFNRTIFVSIFFAISFNVFAASRWMQTDNDPKTYIDTQTLKRSKNIAQAWVMWNLSLPVELEPGKKAMSMIHLREYDCDKKMSRQLRSVHYAKNNGEGVPLFDFKYPKASFELLVPGSKGEEELETICISTKPLL